MITMESKRGRGRPKAELVLSRKERAELKLYAAQLQAALKATVLLATADGKHDALVAEETSLSRTTIGGWRRRYVAERRIA